MKFESTDPVEQFLIEVHRLCDRDGRIGGYRLGEDPPDELRIARILVAKIAAMEREACANLCERMARRMNSLDIRTAALEMAAENIRARGQA